MTDRDTEMFRKGWMAGRANALVENEAHMLWDQEASRAVADPHIRADERGRVLAEVDAALRDRDAYIQWSWRVVGSDVYVDTDEAVNAADYLRDVFKENADNKEDN